MVRRIIYPPVWLLFGLILTFVLNEFFPGVRFTSLEGQVVGGIVILIGLVLLVTANGLFTRAAMPVVPDLVVERVGEDYIVFHNDRNIPRLRVNQLTMSLVWARGPTPVQPRP